MFSYKQLPLSSGFFTGDLVEEPRPFRVMSLYSGGTFDKNYNKRYQPIKFPVPASTKKVRYQMGEGVGNTNIRADLD